MAAIDQKNYKESLTNEKNKHKEEAKVREQLKNERDLEQTLIKELLTKEAELKSLKKKIRAELKKYKKIVKSRTWKYTFPLRQSIQVFQKLKHSIFSLASLPKLRKITEENKVLQESNQSLEAELKNLHKQLAKAENEIKLQALEKQTVESGALHLLAKQAKEKGQVVDYTEGLISKKIVMEKNYSEALRKTARLYSNEQSELQEAVYASVLNGFKIEDIPEFIIRAAESDKRISLKAAASFKASLSMRARLRQLRTNTPEHILDNKLVAYAFADNLGIKKPWAREERYRFAEIEPESGIVIKPYNGAGSRGVYLIYSHDKIKDVRRARDLCSWSQLRNSITEDLSNGWVTNDEWIIEELIVEDRKNMLPAKDLKFYCFYGEIALILEIIRVPQLKYCWWTSDGERIDTGKYSNQLFKGSGISSEKLQYVASLSEKIPVPFMRIDFLKSEQGLFFGEFTPKPGNYDEFDKKTDQLLGDYYLEAEERLVEDLLNGKVFVEYKEIEKQFRHYSR